MDRRVDWAALPPLALTEVLSYLKYSDRLNAGRVCKLWYRCSLSARLWRKFSFSFVSRCWDPSALIERHGAQLRDVAVLVAQQDESRRRSACDLISKLSGPQLSLTAFKITFVSDNPYFYSGVDFIKALSDFFRNVNTLERVDLSGLDLNLDDHLLTLLYSNNRCLKSVNLNNKSLPTLISSGCVKSMIASCERLEELSLRHSSISEVCLEALLEPECRSLKMLAIKCTRQEKFTKDLSPDTWAKLTSRYPGLRVAFHFDHTCLLNKIADILKPGIKVSRLYFLTYTRIHEELAQVVLYYADTLDTLVIDAQSSPDLDAVLQLVAVACKMLKTVKIFCPVSPDVVSTFQKEHQHKQDFKLVLDRP